MKGTRSASPVLSRLARDGAAASGTSQSCRTPGSQKVATTMGPPPGCAVVSRGALLQLLLMVDAVKGGGATAKAIHVFVALVPHIVLSASSDRDGELCSSSGCSCPP